MGRLKQHSKSGFTLIELLVVIAIISLLSSALMANISATRAKANDAVRVVTIEAIQTALSLYYDDHGHYPQSSGENSLDTAFLRSLVDGEYLSAMPKDPMNNNYNNFWYRTFRNKVGGSCAQIYEINFDRQRPGTDCPGGIFISATHCHIFYPTGLPCSDPYDLTDGASVPAACLLLEDGTAPCP